MLPDILLHPRGPAIGLKLMLRRKSCTLWMPARRGAERRVDVQSKENGRTSWSNASWAK